MTNYKCFWNSDYVLHNILRQINSWNRITTVAFIYVIKFSFLNEYANELGCCCVNVLLYIKHFLYCYLTQLINWDKKKVVNFKINKSRCYWHVTSDSEYWQTTLTFVESLCTALSIKNSNCLVSVVQNEHRRWSILNSVCKGYRYITKT